ncbi:MAG: type III pantothenate kinase [Gallionella sp.]|nr:type III pantothenate kinase [Gallionella sp.]
MKRLLIDAGNTRIKYALVEDGQWLPVLTLPSSAELRFDAPCYNGVEQVWVSNVAGAEVGRQIAAACAARHWQPHFIASQLAQCGVSNGYALAAQLGSDRWAALIAAWHQVARACLVVNSGTATTIDALSGRGEFLGGLILPGIELMQRSLTVATAGLQAVGGRYTGFPCNTADALFSGAIQASCGAIQRQHALLGDVAAPVLLGGGAAGLLQPYLHLPVQMMDNPVLQGLLLIAQKTNKA